VATSTCVQCLTGLNCTDTGVKYCNTDSHVCVNCLDDTVCEGSFPYCSPTGNCVQCITSANCGVSAACDPETYRCVSTCAGDGDCSSDLGRPICDLSRKVCVQCLSGQDCSFALPECLPGAGICVQCVSDADCTHDGDAAGNPTPRCNTNTNKCVGCLANADCKVGESCAANKCIVVPN
jgi:Cys-rich repeat protein